MGLPESETFLDKSDAASKCDDPWIPCAVLLAAAAAANALAQIGAQDKVQAHWQPETRRKAAPDSEGESQSPAPQKPEAHRRTSAESHRRQSHSQAVSPA